MLRIACAWNSSGQNSLAIRTAWQSEQLGNQNSLWSKQLVLGIAAVRTAQQLEQLSSRSSLAVGRAQQLEQFSGQNNSAVRTTQQSE